MRFTTPRELGLRVRDRRLELGWSQAKLAERVGMTRQWVMGLEKGSAGAALGTVLRTLSELGLVLDVGESHTLPRSYDSMNFPTRRGLIKQVRSVIDSIVDRARVPRSEGGQRVGRVIREVREGPAPVRTPLRRREQG